MRLAILSDIHGNLLALEATLADLEARGGADAMVIAGDLCLAGPQPVEALERVRALDCPVIQGNTDRDLAARPETTADSDDAALLDWTRERLGEDALAYLRALPFAHRVEAPDGEAPATVLIVHANPVNLDDPLRPLAPDEEIAPLLEEVAPDVAVVAFGHLHIPYTRRVGGLLLADIASVGLPKDGDPRASYGVLTWSGGGWTVEQRRVAYPVDEAAAQLRAADPPGAASLART
ncbi:MAG: metallophosphatase family protein, partial [Chloroflexota bacterium]|nr:metallophosphatase family protein [Chloroflexota bacterium]